MIRLFVACLLLSWSLAATASAQLRPGFSPTADFGEQARWDSSWDNVRLFVNEPLQQKSHDRLLLLFATPNGNTLEQTLGCGPFPSRDWHYDIQHVAAQTRRFRELLTGFQATLAIVQAKQLSWPAYRAATKDADQTIANIVDKLVREESAKRVALACHSGGGSFIFGFINAQEAIPEYVERIVLLDANYAYADDLRHGDKLLTWLKGNDSRRLIVIAYDDREIVANGKKVVGPTGGTFRASQRMLDRFGKDLKLDQSTFGQFQRTTALDGRVQFFIHPNPENKILHTALVGDMNGLLQGMTLGTPSETMWGSFGGPRAYGQWVQKHPEVEARRPRTYPESSLSRDLKLPPRPTDAPTGSEFRDRIAALSPEEREAEILKEILAGNVPEFLRRLKPVTVEATDKGKTSQGTCFVTADYLAVGTNDDFFRMPMTPKTAREIAKACNCQLVTVKLANDIFQQAELPLIPIPMTRDRESVATFHEHQRLIERQRGERPLGLLTAGIKKDLVLTKQQADKPGKVAIYGWHLPEGDPIQPLYLGHAARYVDYSHGVRLVSNAMLEGKEETTVAAVLRDPDRSRLISNEGPFDAE